MHTDTSRRIGVVLLAAGASTRLGQPKQLLSFQGESLLRRAARTAVAFGGESLVVLGAGAERLAEELHDLLVAPVVNAQWEEGMASSLRTGIAALPESVEAAIVMLCDQPLLTVQTLQALVEAYQQGSYSAVTSVYASGAPGPPCLFARSLFLDLMALEGQQGAKQIFSRLPPEAVARVAFPEGAYDIDTAEDWQRMQEQMKSGR